MRSSFVATKGLKLVRGPSLRADAARRRWTVVGAVAGLAIVSGILGYFTAPISPANLPTGPFSYFPSE